jgi:hypothetical protein
MSRVPPSVIDYRLIIKWPRLSSQLLYATHELTSTVVVSFLPYVSHVDTRAFSSGHVHILTQRYEFSQVPKIIVAWRTIGIYTK